MLYIKYVIDISFSNLNFFLFIEYLLNIFTNFIQLN